MRTAKPLFVACVVILLAIVLLTPGCGSSKPAALSKPDIVGKITRDSSTLTTRVQMDRTILIEGKIEKGASYDKASVTVNDDTSVFLQADGSVSRTTKETLRVGQSVQATFTGAVRESYPVQAVAAEIVITSEKSIDEVKDAHTDELMAIVGVVGVGIGEASGRLVIKVFLKDSSSELKAKVPATIEGYQVLTEVTGPIETQ